jgi:hypothetical protein
MDIKDVLVRAFDVLTNDLFFLLFEFALFFTKKGRKVARK